MADIKNFYELFTFEKSAVEVTDNVSRIIESERFDNNNIDVWKLCLSCIDLTTLNSQDTDIQVQRMTERVNAFDKQYIGLPNVASICVYPALVETVKRTLTVPVNIASVAACFPSSQTFLSVKQLEVEECIRKGANEIDMVLSVGKFLSGQYAEVYDEIVSIRQIVKPPYRLKVILETGLLEEPALIYNASMIAMSAGADFIKTSSGKVSVNATPLATYVMCEAIKEWYHLRGVVVGYKAAGGISTTEQAVEHYTLVKHVLGDEWLHNSRFRFGASRLANNLLSSILNSEEKYF